MITTGRFRPVQESVLLLYLFTSSYNLFAGRPLPGATSAAVFDTPTLKLWYSILFVASVLSLLGDFRQNWMSSVINDVKSLDRYIQNLLIELIGDILFVCAQIAFITGTLLTSGSIWVRLLIYVVIALGFSGRSVQIILDIRRIRKGVLEAKNALTGENSRT